MSIAPSPALSVKDLVAGYELGMPIVNGASIVAEAGEIVVVLGPNGAGKSTLVKAIAGLVPVFSGQTRLDGKDITSLPAHSMVHHGLAFVPQTENIFASMSVDDNLRLAAGCLPAPQRAERISALYGFFPDLLRQKSLAAGRLSGGQRQMLAIARALIVNPRVLILDEPSAGLSPKLVGLVFEKLQEIRSNGVAIVLVEQNARAALAIADRAYILVEGRNRYEGSGRDLLADPTIGALFLGRSPAARAEEAAP